MLHTLDEAILNLQTTDDLLRSGSMILKDHVILKNDYKAGWVLDPIFSDDKCSIELKQSDGSVPSDFGETVHTTMEYYIVKSGRVLLNINGQNLRILRTGECASVRPGMKHKVIPLEKSEIIAVYVPYTEQHN